MVHLDLCRAAQQGAQGNSSFHPRQWRPDTEVDAAAKAEMRVGQAIEDELVGTVELALVVVEPRWGRRGHGSRLLAATVDHVLADGMTRGVSWIPESDEVTREFLISTGWAPDGLARALDTGAGELRQIRLQTSFVDAG